MKSRSLITAGIVAASLAGVSGAALAQAKEQFIPVLSYRTGAYAPNGVPWANGYVDYFKYVNAKGGLNGVKILFEECETGYQTDKGVECYERLKGKHGGASLFEPLSTGITFALTDKAFNDKIPIMTTGYGRADSADGGVFKWNFPLLGTYWTAADTLVQYIGQKEGGLAKLKGKKITLAYADHPYGKEPIPYLTEASKMHGFELQLLPITMPGIEQKSVWLQIRQSRPDYVFLWGWGVMNSTALKEAVANAKIIKDVLATVHDKGQGTGPRAEVGSVLYVRGMISAMLATEGIKRAQERFGKGKVVTSEQVRWGLENLALDQKKLDALGFAGVMRPVSTSCADHRGDSWSRIHTWDGSKWNFTSDWLQPDEAVIKPMVKASADRYAAEKKLQRRTPADCQS